MRIAHLGTFDVANYGDLLFPLLLEERLRSLGRERGIPECDVTVQHFSPRGGPSVWCDTVPTVPTRTLWDQPPFDAIILGGGHLVHALPTRLPDYQVDDLAATAYAELWLTASEIACRDGARLIWNASGVSRTLSGKSAELLRCAVSEVDHLAVRDAASAAHLRASGVETTIHVAADTALELPRVWTREQLAETYRKVFTSRGREVPERTIAVHVNGRYLEESLESLAARLDAFCAAHDSVAMLLALGACHGDDVLARRLGDAMRSNPLVIDEPRSLRELIACLAHCDVYIGSSLHGLITATAYGRPAWCVARERLRGARKFSGFLNHVGGIHRLAPDWEGALLRCNEAGSACLPTDNALASLERHWRNVDEAVYNSARRPVRPPSRNAESLRKEILLAQADTAAEAVGRAEKLSDAIATLRRSERKLKRARDKAQAQTHALERKSGRLQTALEAANRKLARRELDIAALSGWLDRLRHGIDALLTTRRWRLGNACGNALNWLLRRREPLVTELFQDVFRRHRRWRLPRPALAQPLASSVTVVVPIHNAVEDVSRCLEALHRHTDPRHTIVLVDDASNLDCRIRLDAFVAEHPETRLIRHSERLGYTRSANAGWQTATSDFVVLLNSDTIVTPGWLERLLACAARNASIGMVGPLSNAASWQSVPELFDDHGDWAVNALPMGWQADDVARGLASGAHDKRSGVPLLNGFCLLICRALWERIGFFDEAAFPDGYGEETDYCLRAVDAGFTLAVAHDAYVFHAKSRSYGHDRRRALTERGQQALRAKHGRRAIEEAVHSLRGNPALQATRTRVRSLLTQTPLRDENRDYPSVLFLLPVRGGGGGAHSVVQEAAGMRALGTSASVAIEARFADEFARQYPSWYADGLFFVYTNKSELQAFAAGFEVVVATVYFSMRLLRGIVRRNPRVLPAYYVQDYEPKFFPRFSRHAREARRSYGAIPGLIHFAKTAWIRQEVAGRHGVAVHPVTASIDHAVYYPKAEKRMGPVRIAAMIRPGTPYRGAERTLRVLRKVQAEFPACELHFFGASAEEQARFTGDNPSEHWHGRLTREQVAELLRNVEIFVDLSDYQAFGRTALEAMACGAAVIVPKAGGSSEYATHEVNAIVADTSDEHACATALRRLLADVSLRQRLAEQGLATSAGYSIESAARSELKLFQRELNLRTTQRAPVSSSSSPSSTSCEKEGIHAVLSSSAHGWPSSSHIRVLLPLQHTAVAQHISLTHGDSQRPVPADAQTFLVQRTALPTLAAAKSFIGSAHARRQRIVLDIDDNLWELPKDHPERRRYRRLLPALDYLLDHSDAVTVPTKTLADALRSRAKNICIVPNALDERLWFPDEPTSVRDNDGPVRFLLMGTRTHGADLEVIAPAARRLIAEFGERVRFEVIGCLPRGVTGDWFRVLRVPSGATEYPAFVRWLAGRRSRWQIGLAPLADNAFNACKSPLKYLDYSALGLAGVFSDVPAYTHTVRQLDTGLLTPNLTESWLDAMRMLVLNRDFRRQLATSAQADVRRNHVLSVRRFDWVDTLFPGLQPVKASQPVEGQGLAIHPA